MNSFKAFFKEKGLYLVCLALVLIATVTGVLAVNRVVASVADLTAARQKALEENSVWNQPDTIVTNPAEDVPVATPAPTQAPSSASPAPSAESSALQPQSSGSAGAGGSGGPAASQGASSTWPVDAEPAAAFSGDELVYNETLGDWRTHNGIDISAVTGTAVTAASDGIVTGVHSDPMWGNVVEVTSGEVVMTYAGLGDDIAVSVDQQVTAGETLGSVGQIPCELSLEPHLHFDVQVNGDYVDPASLVE